MGAEAARHEAAIARDRRAAAAAAASAASAQQREMLGEARQRNDLLAREALSYDELYKRNRQLINEARRRQEEDEEEEKGEEETMRQGKSAVPSVTGRGTTGEEDAAAAVAPSKL